MKKLLLILLVLFGLQTRAQMSPCDSVGYSIQYTGSTLLVLNEIMNSSSIVIYQDWTICDDNLCFADTGQVVTFNQFATTDTLKLCYVVVLEDNNVNTWTCLKCDTLVYDPINGWMLMSAGNPLGINEIKPNTLDNKMYDLLGREIFEIQLGQIYIKNNKKCILIK